MNIYKRIISLSVAFAMCISLMIAPASATELVPSGQYQLTNYSRAFALGAVSDLSLDYIQNIGGYLSTLWEAMKTGSCDGCSANPADGRHNFLPRDGYMITWEAGLKGNAACDCQYCGITFDEFCNSTYNQYVSSLQTDLGTTTLIDGGVRVYFAFEKQYVGPRVVFTSENLTANSFDVSFYCTYLGSIQVNGLVRYKTNTIYAPFEGTYQYGSSGAASSSGSNFKNMVGTGSGNCRADASFMLMNAFEIYATEVERTVRATGQAWVDFYPVDTSLNITQNITVNSRPSTIVGDYGIIGNDGTIIKVDGNMIVDESTNTVYNPVTNVTNNYTDYAFDYSDRSYNLTLKDGSTLKVIYGDENVTIHEGDTVYNVYYLLPDSSEDPGGSGGSGDTPGTDDGSGWAWLQGAWTQMMDKLSQIREAIVGLELSPEINVEVEVEGEEQVTQESWFTDVLSKFSFLSSIRDIYSQLIADVTSDAATAAAVADGEIMLADVTTGHAATDGRASYTAPELAISFGSSDKYGVDWAGIRPLDLSWYAPYKETVDGILSGILWLSYLFLLIKRAPGIIRGSEMVTEDKIKIDAWRMRH